MFCNRNKPWYAVLGMLVVAVVSVSKFASASGCDGTFYLMVNGNGNQVVMQDNMQLCSGVPVNIWFYPYGHAQGLEHVLMVLDEHSSRRRGQPEGAVARCERVPPFALFGDLPPGSFLFDEISAGEHYLKAFCGRSHDSWKCGGPSNSGIAFEVVDCPDPANR